jgi:hypothetical protein
MHQLPIEQQILLVVEIVALATLCLRMWLAGLHRIYIYFFGYLLLELLQSLIPVLVPLKSRLYRDAFVVSQVVIVAFYALVVLELYSKALRDLAGIAGIARHYIKLMLALAIVLAVLPLPLENSQATLAGYFLTYERIVMASLLLFVLFISLFLLYYPVPLGKNVISYLMGYAVYFFAKTTVPLVINLGHDWIRELSSVAMAVSVLCLTFWIIALRRDGETKRVVVGHQWNLADQQKLNAQLDAINASLLRASGK